MNYPVWDVPFIGSGWVIGGIAIFHILISHFAVGAGLYLPMAEKRAYERDRKDWIEILKKHSHFFLILTGVFGALSGVAIWFAIGLASPEGTSTLIHNFVFAWAIEWCFFFMELTAAALYYYTWDRVSPQTHLRIGWFYAFASFFTLAVINGILTFMLTPSDAWLQAAGTGQEGAVFWSAFFNPTYWPSVFLRFVVCTSLAGIWALVTASRIDGEKQGELKTDMVRWSTLWLFPSFLLMPLLGLWFLHQIPEAQQGLLQLGISTIGEGTFTHVTRASMVTLMSSATILAVVYFIAYYKPKEFRFGYSLAILALALMATGSTEHSREMLRKPFVVANHMYSNGIRKSDVAEINAQGYMQQSPWNTSENSDAQYRGKRIFQGQCLACHTRKGYRSLTRLLHGRDREGIKNLITMLHEYPDDSPYRAFMPPVVGTANEVDDLVTYLDSFVNADTGEHAP